MSQKMILTGFTLDSKSNLSLLAFGGMDWKFLLIDGLCKVEQSQEIFIVIYGYCGESALICCCIIGFLTVLAILAYKPYLD